MKKNTLRAFSVLTSAVLAVAAMPFSSYTCLALSESGIADMSGVVMKYGDFSGESDSAVLPAVLSSNDDEDYLLGAHLDANNTAVYEKFAELVNPSLESFTVKLPEPVTFTSESKSYSGSQEFYNAVFGSCASGMEAASYDIPMLFWLDINLTSVSTARVPYTYNFWTGLYTYTLESITFNPAYGAGFSSLDEVMEYKVLLEDAVENFTADGDTIEEQLKSIHDHICLFTEYNLEGRFISSALGALVESGSVCEGYSKGFKILADKLGIPTVCIFGNYNEEAAEAHMWNYVRMDDGFWYAVDVTWDDYDGKYGIDFNYNYFLKGSDSFFIRHTPCESYSLTRFEYPEIASWNYGENPAETTTSTTTTTARPTTTSTTTTTARPTTTSTTTTTARPTTTSTTTTTARPTTTSTTTTARPTTTSTTTTAKPTTTSTTTTAKPTTTSTTTTTAKPTTTSTTTTTAKPTTTSTTTTAKPTTTSSTAVYPEFQKGDLNHDGIVSVADLVYCANYVLGKEKTEHSCDVNGDGRTDVFDVVEMRKIVIFKTVF